MPIRVPLLSLALVSALSLPALGQGGGVPVPGGATGPPPTRSWVVPRFVPVTELQLDGFLLAFLVEEVFHGDLNADGDATDEVLHVLNLATRSLTNVGLAPPSTGEELRGYRLRGRTLLCLVSEAAQGGLDRNGDGDASDAVLCAYDVPGGTATNLGLAANPVDFDLRDGLGVVLVNEQAQGGVDLDGNASLLDSVPHVWDEATGTLTNLAVPAYTVQIAGGRVVYEAGEANGDLNGDGDQDDRVLHVYDPLLATTTNLGVATYSLGGFLPPLRPVVSDTLVLQLVGEGEQGGSDLNGDGDALDLVLHVHDLDAGTTTSTGHASRDYAPLALHAAGERFAAFLVSEADDGGLDANGDGDALDAVLHVFDRLTGATTSTGLQASTVAFDAGRAAVLVREAAQGATDLNGDGDTGDFVLHVHDAASAATMTLPWAGQGAELIFGLPANPPRIRGELVAFAVVEAAQGATDLNGDGDTSDRVLFVHDLASGTSSGLGLAIPFLGTTFEPGLDRLVCLSDEAAQGADQNGDGDTQDAIAFFWDRATGALQNSALAILKNDVRSPFELEGGTTGYLLEAGPTEGFLGITLQARLSSR